MEPAAAPAGGSNLNSGETMKCSKSDLASPFVAANFEWTCTMAGVPSK